MSRDLDPARLRTRVDRALAEDLAPAVIARRAPLRATIRHLDGEPLPFAAVRDAAFDEIAPGTRWGPPWSTAWFRLGGRVPEDWPDRPVETLVDLGFDQGWPGFQAEGLAYDVSGGILKAVEPLNTHVRLPAAPGQSVDFFVEAAANPDILRHETFTPTPLGHPETAGRAPLYVFVGAELVQRDDAVQALVDDVRVLRGLLDVLPPDRPRSAHVRRALAEMLGALDPRRVAATAEAARRPLADVLARPAAASAHRVDAVGHAHIDSAWLWPVRETIRKCARTFSNVLDLMDEDPDLVFACSSAQQYAWMAQHHPALHERIAHRVAEGRWVVTGGMWVESDTMMPSGESLVRQFVEGSAYFREAFGVEAAGVWLPDSFGYSAGMPQIAVAAGAEWFLTQKLSWNDTNRMPHHTFWWRGIDGSRIFTHFPPSDTYSAEITPAELDLAERQFTEHAWSSRSLMLFGHGDGGGGPTRRMMAAARRSADLEGLPRVRVVSPDVFFADARDEQPDAAEWAGELYLELHRGTFTAQARTKAGNRRNEQLLHAAELWSTTATVRTGRPYPSEALREAWRNVLLLQFHDILPGSSIGWVHEQAEAAHAEVTAALRALIDDALSALAGPGSRALHANAATVPVAGLAPGAVGVADTAGTDVSAGGWRDGDDHVLEDASARVRVGPDGGIRSFVDLRTDRELVAGEGFGVPRLHPDRPARWDAWDIDRHHAEASSGFGRLVSLRTEEGVVTVRRETDVSTLEQEWWLEAGRLHTRIRLDWHDRGSLVKLGFPVAVDADHVETETQFGHVSRPLARNTPWDEARFEVCQHRWLHVGEPGFGVAVANDTAYGVSFTRGDGVDVAISLVRGAEFPDPALDIGRHEFRFAIAATGSIDDAVALGRELGAPLATVRGGTDVAPLIDLGGAGLVCETVTLAEDGSGDVVVRISEFRGARSRGILTTDFDWTDAALVDLHERTLSADSPLRRGVTLEADPRARRVRIEDRPFGLLTLRFRR